MYGFGFSNLTQTNTALKELQIPSHRLPQLSSRVAPHGQHESDQTLVRRNPLLHPSPPRRHPRRSPALLRVCRWNWKEEKPDPVWFAVKFDWIIKLSRAIG